MHKKLFIILTFTLALFLNRGFGDCIEDFFSSSPDQMVTLTESQDFLIGDIIHPLSGQPCLHQVDLVAKGAQSIELKRLFIPFYTPLNEHNGKIHPSKSGYGGWVYFPHSRLNVFRKGKNKSNRFLITETIVSFSDPQGAVLAYLIDKNGNTKLKTKPWGICNGINDHPSGMYDPRNTSISVENLNVTLKAPDGTMRYYSSSDCYELSMDKAHYLCLYCLLRKEILPNGHVIRYQYNKERQIVKVESLDPKEKHVYASLDFDIHSKDIQSFTTNTGMQAAYLHDTPPYHSKNERNVDLLYPLRLTKVISPFFKNEEATYYTNSKGDSILTEYSGKHPIFKCAYIFNQDKKKKDKKAPDAVELSLPSETTSFSPVYFMQYVQGVPGEEKSSTTVTHCDGIKTVYTFNPQMLPENVREYDQQGNLIKGKTFCWTDNQWLKTIRVTDGRQQLLSEKTFQYDTFGNPISEVLKGDLTGSGQTECNEIKRVFSKDHRNLLLREEHSNGKVISYTYLPETNLLTSCLVKENGARCLSREFRCYDGCHHLIQIINDDGSTDGADDLADVSERKIINYCLRQQQPFLHMPEQIEEKYWENGIEKLLKRTLLVYDQWGNVVQEQIYDSEEKFAYTIFKEYDEQGNLLSETNSLGQKTNCSYDDYGRKKTSINFPNNLYTSHDYDYKGRLIKTQENSTDGITRNFSFTHDDKNRLMKKTDSYNHSTTYSYDLVTNQPIQITLPALHYSNGKVFPVTENACYDALGRKTIAIDPNGNRTSYSYNIYGSPTVIIYPDQSQERFIYQKNGLLVSHTSQNGLTTDYQYDILDNVISKSFSFNKDFVGKEEFEYKGSKLLKRYDLEGNLTQYAYDGLGRKISEEKCGCRTTYQYDSLGNIAWVVEENGEHSLHTHFKYDLLGRILEKKKTEDNRSLLSKISYSYDGNGNIHTIERNINGHEAVETFTYDAYNREKSRQDAQGHLTTTHYDEKAFNNLQQVLKKSIKDPQEILTVETYDPYGRIVKQETLNAALEIISAKEKDYDACGNQLLHQDHVYQGTNFLATKATKWTYDPCHRVKSLTRALNTRDVRTTEWTYHPNGKVASKMLPDGLVLNYTYDALDNLKSIQSSDGNLSHTFMYNRLGHLLSASDDLNHLKITREIDSHGNILLEEFPNGIQVKKKYDHFHRPVSIDMPDGSKVVYHYDPLFLKKVERLALSGQTTYEHIYESYDESGYLLTEHLPANLGIVNYETDVRGQPIAIVSDYFKQVSQYDCVGNLTTQIINGTDREFAYDDLSQLISEPDNTYTYDSMYNRTDENGNKCQFNALDEPLSNQETSFIYDMRGNLIKRTVPWQTQRFSYDPLDRLIEAVIEDKRICYSYDPLGRKLKKTVEMSGNEKRECFFYDGKSEIGVATDKGEIKQLKILGLGDHPEKRNAVAIELGGKAYAPLSDAQGNVRALVDMASKVLAASYDYSAFGKQLPLPNKVFNPWQYASKRYDPDIGLIDFGRRHYDPLLGRWLSVDPAGFVNSHNLYQFNFNNPYRYYDPDGQLIFIPLLCGAFGAGVLGATVVTVELIAVDVIIGAAVTGAALWGMSEGLTAIDRAINNHRFSPYMNEAVEESVKRSDEETKKGRKKGRDNKSRGGPARDELNGDYLPDNTAEGAHTTFGTRVGTDGNQYIQGATFNDYGEFIGRTDVTNHGRSDHSNPHFHDATSSNSANGAAKPIF